MTGIIAAPLVRHAHWSPDVQLLLLHSPLRELLCHNEHLDPAVARALAATADWEQLARLADLEDGPLLTVEAIGARAAELAEQSGAPLGEFMDDMRSSASDLDQELAYAISTATDETTAVTALACLPSPVGPYLSRLRLALGLDVTVAAAHIDRDSRMSWLTSPQAAHLDDDTVWGLLETGADKGSRTDRKVDRHRMAAILLQRPALADRSGGPEFVRDAARMLTQAATTTGLVADAGPTSKRAREAALRALEAEVGGNWSCYWHLQLTPWKLAHLATITDWSDTQRARLAAALERDTESQKALGGAAALVAAAFGTKLAPDMPTCLVPCGWAAARNERPGSDWPEPGPDVLAKVGSALVQPNYVIAGPFLTRALAADDPDVEAARWLVAMRLADSFTGTFAELAEAATAVAAPVA